jgi:hypothetical protein
MGWTIGVLFQTLAGILFTSMSTQVMSKGTIPAVTLKFAFVHLVLEYPWSFFLDIANYQL